MKQQGFTQHLFKILKYMFFIPFCPSRNTGYTKGAGFIALSLVLIIMATTLLIASTAGFLAIGEGQSALSLLEGEDSLQFAEGCMEDALHKARADINYTSGAITRPEGTCTITVSKAGTTWTITAATADTAYRRTIQAVITRATTGITLTSWKEL